MLGWAVFFLVLAVIAAFFGFGGFVVGTLAGVAKLLLFLFLVLFVLSIVFGRSTVPPAGPPSVGPWD